jgi:DNA uptake protein ComE-like DNA-binding protein
MRTFAPLCLLLTLGACAGAEPTPATEPAATETKAPAPVEPAPAPAPTAAAPRVDLNKASPEELKKLPEMTDRMVHEFEEYRPYASIQQFRKEIGKYVSAEQVAAWEPLVYVPIDPEGCDAPTLQQISGLDGAEAEALVAARPFGSREAFLTRLAEKLTPTELETAKALLVP